MWREHTLMIKKKKERKLFVRASVQQYDVNLSGIFSKKSRVDIEITFKFSRKGLISVAYLQLNF